MNQRQSKTTDRIPEIDYVKCVCIVLMVAFHLVYVEQMFPHAKYFVYLFHMPIFLVISGYYATSSYTKLKGKLRYLGITYLLMESAYIVMAAILPINEHLENISVEIFLQKLFVYPLGPYWYLHTLLICHIVLCVLHNILGKHLSDTSFQILFLSVLTILVGTLLSVKSVVFFGLGVLIKMTGREFLYIIRPSLFAVVPLMLIWLSQKYAFPICNAINGDIIFLSLVVTVLTMSTIIATWRFVPESCKGALGYVGRNTLPILVLSPILTFIAKYMTPLFAWDCTGLVYALFAVTLSIIGCLLTAKVLDCTKITKLVLGKFMTQ